MITRDGGSLETFDGAACVTTSEIKETEWPRGLGKKNTMKFAIDFAVKH
jgi:hypothetical protein